jgi:outer membrane lipoprotein LolB
MHRLALAGRQRAAFGVLAAALIGGCASLTPPEPPLHSYSGRFAADVSRAGVREAVSGRFTLVTFPNRTALDLASPLGNTLARVEVDPAGARLTATKPDGTLATWQGDSPDALVESALGFGLPVSGLADWIAGRAVPDRPARQFPEAGAAQRIEQDGWVITIDERFEETGTPRRLSLRRDDAASATSLGLRLVLDPPGNVAFTPQ